MFKITSFQKSNWQHISESSYFEKVWESPGKFEKNIF